MRESVRFDRAVAYYDRTRALPPEIVAWQAELLMAELRDADRVLEIGVGTGRIGLTLDVPLIGLDLSRPMMEVLRAKDASVPLIEGDATRLPFPDACFDAAYAAHVFHLIPTWDMAFAELVRVVRPGGVLLAARGSGNTDVGRAMHAHMRTRRDPIGADTIEQIDAVASRLGLGVRSLEAIAWTAPFDVGAEIAGIANREWSGLWEVPDDEVRRAVDIARAWAVERFGAVDAVVPATSSFAWHAYQVPS